MSDKKEPLPLAEARAAVFGRGDDTQYAYVDCPEWGCRLRVRSLTAEERGDYEAAQWRLDDRGKPVKNREANRLARGWLVARGTVDAKGTRVFADDDAAELSRRNAAAVDRVASAVARLSGMEEDAAKEEEGN